MLVGDSGRNVPIRYVVVDEDDGINILPTNDTPQPDITSKCTTLLSSFEGSVPTAVDKAPAKSMDHVNCKEQCEDLFLGPFTTLDSASSNCQQSKSYQDFFQGVPNGECLGGTVGVALKNLNGFIRCAICDRRFTASKYSEHIKNCLLEKPFKCELCNEEYNKDENLSVHRIIAHPEVSVVDGQQQECPICRKVFSRTSAYYGHLKQHFVSETLCCSICKDEFEYLAFLNHHVRIFHNSADEDCFSSSQFCTRCGILVPNKEDMEKHILVHRKINKAMRRPKRKKLSDISKQHKCTVCEKGFTKLYELTRHSVVHTKEKRFECIQCGKKFSQKSSMRQHMKSHESSSTSSYKCELCEATFSQAGNLRRHVSLLHPADVSSRIVFRCPHCTCVFNSIQPLQVHMGKRHPDDSKVVPSSSCIEEPATSTTLQNLKEKTIKCLAKRRLMCCSICGKAFAKSGDLVRHYRIHSGDRPFACNLCAEKFSSKFSLNLHLQIHTRQENCADHSISLATYASLRRQPKTQEKALEHCGICDQSFLSKKALETHQVACVRENIQMETCKSLLDLSNIAGNEQNDGAVPFQFHRCSTCSASSSDHCCSKEHIDLHIETKSHFCRICAKPFCSLGQLKSHSVIHSSMRSLKCGICSETFKRKEQFKTHLQKRHGKESDPEHYEILIDDCENGSIVTTDAASEPDVNDAEFATRLFNLSDNHSASDVARRNETYSAVTFSNERSDESANCPVCLFSFCSDNALSSHLSNMITDDAHKYAALSCDRCLIPFTGCAALAEHIKTTHCPPREKDNFESTVSPSHLSSSCSRSQRKVHQCETCGRAFTKPCDLTRHRRIHTGEKPFKCNICDRAFRVKSTLYQHMKVHDDDRESNKHLCSVCNRCYRSTSALKMHLKLDHAEERSFKCSVATCDRRFVTLRQRNVHVRRVHVEHKGEEHQGLIPFSMNSQFEQTVAQLTPSSKTACVIEQSQGSAFSRLDAQETFNGPTHIALKIRPGTTSENVEVQVTSLCGVIPDDGSIVMDLSMLRQLVSEGLLVKVPITLQFLSSDSSLTVDARRVFKLLENKQTELMIVPLNAATELTNLPVAVFECHPSTVAREQSHFISNCVICDQNFETVEQSEAHFQSEDHETAQLFSMPNLADYLGSHETAGDMTQYQPPLRSVATEACKFRSIPFEARGSWLAQTRRDGERNNLEFAGHSDLRVRRRTLN